MSYRVIAIYADSPESAEARVRAKYPVGKLVSVSPTERSTEVYLVTFEEA